MSQGDVVRIEVRTRSEPRRRTLDERLAFRMPALAHLLVAGVYRFPPRSRVRRALHTRFVRRGYAALDRGDLELNKVTLYDKDAVISWPRDVPVMDSATYRGREAAFNAYGKFREAFPDLRREPREIIDLGDKLVVLLIQSGHGAASGAEVSARAANIFTVRGGRIVRHEEFLDWEQALEAAGLQD